MYVMLFLDHKLEIYSPSLRSWSVFIATLAGLSSVAGTVLLLLPPSIPPYACFLSFSSSRGWRREQPLISFPPPFISLFHHLPLIGLVCFIVLQVQGVREGAWHWIAALCELISVSCFLGYYTSYMNEFRQVALGKRPFD